MDCFVTAPSLFPDLEPVWPYAIITWKQWSLISMAAYGVTRPRWLTRMTPCISLTQWGLVMCICFNDIRYHFFRHGVLQVIPKQWWLVSLTPWKRYCDCDKRTGVKIINFMLFKIFQQNHDPFRGISTCLTLDLICHFCSNRLKIKYELSVSIYILNHSFMLKWHSSHQPPSYTYLAGRIQDINMIFKVLPFRWLYLVFICSKFNSRVYSGQIKQYWRRGYGPITT